MKSAIAIAVLLLASGCEPDPAPVKTVKGSDNAARKYDVLFTDADGYAVKRFEDGGRVHYYVTPGGSTVTTSYDEHQGKTMVERHESITTAK